MNKILEKHFIDTYPKIFKDMYGDMKETCMHWGLECGNGWLILLDVLCYRIQEHIDWHNKYLSAGEDPIAQVVAQQVKEKFGSLRFYYSGGDEYISGLVQEAEDMSGFICEDCGSSGVDIGTTKGWIQHLCPRCAEKCNKSITPNKKLLKLMREVEKDEEVKRVGKKKGFTYYEW